MSERPNNASWLERLSKMFNDEPESREELVAVLKEAHNHGIIDRDALLMSEGVLNVSEARVRDIMIPKPQIEFIDVSETLDEVLARMLKSSHSRYPLMKEGEVIGILLAKDVLRAQVNGDLAGLTDLESLYRQPNFVPESKRLNVMLREFKSTRNHLALVVDEYAELAGLVTIEDVLEQIVGDIEDEHDVEEGDNIHKRAGNAFAVKATTSLDEFNKFFEVQVVTDNTETIGGFMATELGHVPVVGETLERHSLLFKVLKASDRCAELFEVTWLDPDQLTEPAETTQAD